MHELCLVYDFDDTDDGSKSAPPSQSSSSSGRKLGPVNGNEKGDGNVFGHSLVKGEDEVVEKIRILARDLARRNG